MEVKNKFNYLSLTQNSFTCKHKTPLYTLMYMQFSRNKTPCKSTSLCGTLSRVVLHFGNFCFELPVEHICINVTIWHCIIIHYLLYSWHLCISMTISDCIIIFLVQFYPSIYILKYMLLYFKSVSFYFCYILQLGNFIY